MNTTIDKAGRVVIPIALRQAAGFQAGETLEVVLLDDGSVGLRRRVSPPKLVKRDGGWIAEPTVPREELPKVDIGALIRQERDRWPW